METRNANKWFLVSILKDFNRERNATILSGLLNNWKGSMEMRSPGGIVGSKCKDMKRGYKPPASKINRAHSPLIRVTERITSGKIFSLFFFWRSLFWMKSRPPRLLISINELKTFYDN